MDGDQTHPISVHLCSSLAPFLFSFFMGVHRCSCFPTMAPCKRGRAVAALFGFSETQLTAKSLPKS
jgi:hypothetical protein